MSIRLLKTSFPAMFQERCAALSIVFCQSLANGLQHTNTEHYLLDREDYATIKKRGRHLTTGTSEIKVRIGFCPPHAITCVLEFMLTRVQPSVLSLLLHEQRCCRLTTFAYFWTSVEMTLPLQPLCYNVSGRLCRRELKVPPPARASAT